MRNRRVLDESYYAFEGVDNTENVSPKRRKSGVPYLNLSNVEEIYISIKGSSKGVSAFSAEARKIATRSRSCLIFKDEAALFEIFKQFLGKELEVRDIHSWGELMQYIS